MEEIIEQPTLKTMFAKLGSLNGYTALNNLIGNAKSYPDEKSDTLSYSDPNPVPVGDFYYMEITAEVQDRWPEVLEGVELIERKLDDAQDQEQVDTTEAV